MFFHRNHRIRTEPRIPNEVEEDPRHHQRRIKIKNIRFSFEQDPHKPLPTRIDDPSSEMPNPHKRLGIGQRLPELVLEREEEEIKEARETSVQHRKKDILLNSILQILRPPRPLPLRPLREWRLDSSKDYVNEFVDELPHFNSTKHYRAPKLIENEILRTRRKIFSEDKDRQRESQKAEELVREKKEQRPEADLQKIEIITFSNKFPGLKKEGSQDKPQQ